MELKRQEIKAELTALRQEADKSGRMFKSLYESLVSGLITAEEYRDMREAYETKTQKSLARAAELENRQAELDRQVAEYFELSDLIADPHILDLTGADKLVRGVPADFQHLAQFLDGDDVAVLLKDRSWFNELTVWMAFGAPSFALSRTERSRKIMSSSVTSTLADITSAGAVSVAGSDGAARTSSVWASLLALG